MATVVWRQSARRKTRLFNKWQEVRMSAYLIGVTATGGVPLFARQSRHDQPDGQSQSQESLPFATLAALNGVNLFSRLNEADLLSCTTKESMIRWKVYRGSIVLIAITTSLQVNEKQLLNFLDIVFDCLVLTCGLAEITCQNIERLKRCLKHSYLLLDYLIGCLVSQHIEMLSMLTNNVQFDLSGEHRDFLYSLVESVAQFSSSSFCSLLVNNQLVSATKQWWTRLSSSRDALVISLFVNSQTQTRLSQTSEFVVFLPENCPSAATRLIITELYEKVYLCLLCGETPNLETIENDIVAPLKESKMHQEKLACLACSLPKIAVDNKVIGFVVMRDDVKIISQFGSIGAVNYKSILKLIDLEASLNKNSNFESFFNMDNFKCYFILHDHFKLFVVLPLNVPLNEMRILTSKTLNSLIRDKHIWP